MLYIPIVNKESARQSIGFFLEPNLTGSVRPFTNEPTEPPVAEDDTYAATLLQTIAIREAHRLAKEKEAKQQEANNQ